ncbi:MAG TPA: shikimate dehydrogenase [Candidatus Eisenbacteria bacterium]|nr:shikimate dehydrogenase [Candidatus Eisenbacteria bacterium]
MRFAVLGRPVAHSLSPAIQNAAFAAAGLDAVYETREVGAAELADALASLGAEGFAGLNLTAPLKEAVWPLLSGATPEASLLRSVNTLKRVGGGWEGHATDGLGFAAWAREVALPVAGARVLLLGSGGAARAVAPYLAALGASAVTVASRDASRAASVTALGERRNGGTGWSAASLDAAPEEEEAFDLLVRALSVAELADGERAWWARLAEGAPVVDLNYGARAAAIRAAAAGAGRPFHDGLGMLLHQGALSFTYWTGREAPLEAMRRALKEAAPG